MAGGGGVHDGGMDAPWQIPRDTVNEQAVRILLECILVFKSFTKGYLLANEKEKSDLRFYQVWIWGLARSVSQKGPYMVQRI